MKAFTSTCLLLLCLVTLSFARGGDTFLSIRSGDGSVRTAKLNPDGSCTFDNVKPGTYSVALLLPAVQKVREAAARTSNTSPTATEHDKWIELESWSWGVSNAGASAHGSGGGAGKVSMQDMHFSPKPMKATRGQLSQKTTHNGQEYYQYKLEDVIISSYSSSSSPAGDRPMESLSLNFTKITYKVK